MAKKVEWDIIFRLSVVILSISAVIYFSNQNKAKSEELRRINDQKGNLIRCQKWMKTVIDEVVKEIGNQKKIIKTKKIPKELLQKATVSVNQNATVSYPLQTPLIWETSAYHHTPGFNIGFLDREVHFYEITHKQLLIELKKIDDTMKLKNSAHSYEFPFSYSEITYKKFKKLAPLKNQKSSN